MNTFKKRLIIGLVALVLLSPLGILIPSYFHSGDAWGEWSVEQVKKDLGFIPKKMKKAADLYKAPLPDYSNGNPNASLAKSSVFYILSGMVGVGLIGILTWGLIKIYKGHE